MTGTQPPEPMTAGEAAALAVQEGLGDPRAVDDDHGLPGGMAR